MASFGHSGSHAPQLMQSDVMYVDMAKWLEGSPDARNLGSGRGDVKPARVFRPCAGAGGKARVRPSATGMDRAPAPYPAILAALAIAAAATALGCAPSIGDRCNISTD